MAYPTSSDRRYWDGVVDAGLGSVAIPLWRAFCDQLHAGVIREWLGGRRFSTALKTDLFEEAIGDGLAGLLLAASDRVDGIDVSESIVRLAALRHPRLSVHVADVRHLDENDGSFDLIVSTSTLDHFADRPDIGVAIGELARVLAPEGLMFVTFDNPVNPVVAVRNRLPAWIFGRTPLVPYFVGHTLSLAKLRYAVENAGLEVIRAGHIMHVPRILFLHSCRLFNPATRSAQALLRFMLSFETLARLPTAPLTGHFAGVLARKPPR